MARLNAIIFDLDGTLIHSAPDLQLASNEALEAIDRGPLDLATIVSFIGDGVETLARRCLEMTGGADEKLRQDYLAHFLEVYSRNVTTHTRPYPGVVAALEKFRADGLALGVCTNKPQGPARKICQRLKLAQYFDTIVGAVPDLAKKPDPASLFKSMEVLGTDQNHVLYVGDSAVDFQTARNAAVPFRLFSGGYLNAPLPDLPAGDRFAAWAEHGIATSCSIS